MSDEEFIKEVNKLMNCIENNTELHWKNYYKDVDIERIYNDLVLDINEIKRLTEENKELKDNYCNRTDCSSRIKDSKKYDSLQQRIDKAIEYIQNNDIYFCKLSENKIVNNDNFSEISIFPKIDLLEILEGGK